MSRELRYIRNGFGHFLFETRYIHIPHRVMRNGMGLESHKPRLRHLAYLILVEVLRRTDQRCHKEYRGTPPFSFSIGNISV